MLILLCISLPFALAAGLCFVMAERTGAWTNLGWAVYGAIVLGLWALAVVGFFIWLMAREGWLAWHGIPLAILVLAVVAGAIWGGRLWWQEEACSREGAFFDRLAATPMAERADMLEQAPRPLDRLTFCGREMIGLRFLADPYAPLPAHTPEETARLATLALLLERGLPPDDGLYHQAVANADPGAVGIIIARHKALGLEAIPLAFAQQALGGVDADPESPYHAAFERYVAMLALMVREGLDVCQPSWDTNLREAMAARGMPETVWKGAAPDC